MMTSPTSRPISPLLSIAQFCERYGIDKVTYWRMRNRGEGPAEVRIGTRKVRITEVAAAEWEAQHTHQPGTDAPTKKKPVE